jgi:tetratricopeptide (TPR) repeat protein
MFDTEEGNLWSALDWSIRTRRADLAGRLTWALFIFWWLRGRRERGRKLVSGVLSLELPEMLRARAVHAAAALSEPGTEPPEAVESRYLHSVELAERCGDAVTEAASAIGAGLIALERGDPGTAEQRVRRGLTASERAGEEGQWTRGLAHAWLATACRFQGDAPNAIQHAGEALAHARRRGDTLNESIALYNLAHAELLEAQHDRARTHLIDALMLCRQTRDASNLSYLLDTLATVEFGSGSSSEHVAALLGAAEALRESVRSAAYRWYAPDVALRERTADLVRAMLGDEAYQRALDAGRGLTLEGAVDFALREAPARG